MTIESFSHVLSTALVETLEHHTDRLRGDKIYGATLVRSGTTLVPSLSVLADLGGDDSLSPVHRWSPVSCGLSLQTPRLTEICALFDAHLDATPALTRALGSQPLRATFARLGAEPILYVYDDAAGGIEHRSFTCLNAGRESEPYYVQAAKLVVG
ncbi:hypothetical protein [Corynebacterium sp.]|uniref:hypothetical protein n=1 Tax=Corynebacterium sp. TaxID=1720 RepID=UPI0026E0322D|nr:hypothetical protein [Corynebacterium sp.]MDO5512836.1 hypothetical protein [Corynebacterium sp.]